LAIWRADYSTLYPIIFGDHFDNNIKFVNFFKKTFYDYLRTPSDESIDNINTFINNLDEIFINPESFLTLNLKVDKKTTDASTINRRINFFRRTVSIGALQLLYDLVSEINIISEKGDNSNRVNVLNSIKNMLTKFNNYNNNIQNSVLPSTEEPSTELPSTELPPKEPISTEPLNLSPTQFEYVETATSHHPLMSTSTTSTTTTTSTQPASLYKPASTPPTSTLPAQKQPPVSTIQPSTQAPSKSTQAPSKSTQAPSKSTQAPSKSTQAPSTPTQESSTPTLIKNLMPEIYEKVKDLYNKLYTENTEYKMEFIKKFFELVNTFLISNTKDAMKNYNNIILYVLSDLKTITQYPQPHIAETKHYIDKQNSPTSSGTMFAESDKFANVIYEVKNFIYNDIILVFIDLTIEITNSLIKIITDNQIKEQLKTNNNNLNEFRKHTIINIKNSEQNKKVIGVITSKDTIQAMEKEKYNKYVQELKKSEKISIFSVKETNKDHAKYKEIMASVDTINTMYETEAKAALNNTPVKCVPIIFDTNKVTIAFAPTEKIDKNMLFKYLDGELSLFIPVNGIDESYPTKQTLFIIPKSTLVGYYYIIPEELIPIGGAGLNLKSKNRNTLKQKEENTKKSITFSHKRDLSQYGYKNVKNLSEYDRHVALASALKGFYSKPGGKTSLIRKLNALSLVQKKRDPQLSQLFKEDAEFVSGISQMFDEDDEFVRNQRNKL